LGFGYKGLVFCRNKLINEKNGQGTHSTKKGADKSDKKYLKCPKIFLPKLSAQVWDFDKKKKRRS